ncbi:MAG TPA: efflux transporter outer membrane subunit [Xanthobacteraceae bacterium]|nr:efflux transporter outer membrane subunit [Xanthobacteraceae bacterium]
MTQNPFTQRLVRGLRGRPRRSLAPGPLLAVALLSPGLTGCILTAEKSDPALDLPASYRYGRGNPNAALPKLDWWRGFRSRELTDLMREAEVGNLNIAAAVARVIQADGLARVAGAALLPAIDFDASATRARAPGGPDRAVLSTSLTASYEVDFWGKNRATLRATEENAVASRYDRDVVALAVLASLANQYFTVLASQDRLRIARDNLRAAIRVLDVIVQRREAGTASDLDVAQQESVVAQQRAVIPTLEQLLLQNKVTLAVLVGRAPEQMSVRGGTLDRLALPRVTPGLPAELLTRRPDIREAEAQLAAADANVYAARAAFLPTIQLTGDGGFASNALKTLFRPESAFYSIAAGLTQPIFDGFRLKGLLNVQQGRQEELLQLYRQSVISAFSDVENALIAIEQNAERARRQREVVNSSRRAFDLSETRLREGTIDLVTLLNTQQTLFQALDVMVQVQLARFQAVVSLFQALGGGWQRPGEVPVVPIVVAPPGTP